MDRIASGVLALAGLALLLGGQGARIGPFLVPSFSPWWLVGLAAVVFSLAARGASRLGRFLIPAAVLLAISWLLLVSWRDQVLHPKTSLGIVVDGERRASAPSLQIEHRSVLRRLTGERRNVRLETAGVLEVPRPGTYRFHLYCDDLCDVTLGDVRLRAQGALTRELTLAAGELPLSVSYRQSGGPARLSVQWDGPTALELLPIDYYVRSPGSPTRSRAAAHLALAGFALWWAAFVWILVELGRSRERIFASRFTPRIVAALLVLYGTALRFEAFLAHSGLVERSETAAEIHEALLPWLPPYGIFATELAPEDPYRADVRSYLDRAETMTLSEFYAPSFREPFYVLLVRGFLALTGGSEIGILLQSFLFSAATLVLFWIVAARLHGAWWAAALLVPVSLHHWLVLEAPTGYRMSAYGFFLLAFVGTAILSKSSLSGFTGMGALAGLVTLIRLTALSVVAPVAALRAWSLPREARARSAALFAAALLVLVLPFLVSNLRAHGDPFYSVSFHTEFWLRAEGLDEGQGAVSLVRYFTDFGRVGAVVRGTFLGLTALPLKTFWNGFRDFPLLGILTIGLGVPGLLMLSRSRSRLLAAAYFGHLLPFAYVQNFPSGEMPRFVMPAFFFLVLAVPETAAWGRLRKLRHVHRDAVERAVLLDDRGGVDGDHAPVRQEVPVDC